MLFVSAAEDPANPVGKLVSAQQPLGLNYLAFAVDPLGLYCVEPGALDEQQTWNYPDPTLAGFDPAVMDDDPLSYLMEGCAPGLRRVLLQCPPQRLTFRPSRRVAVS